MPRLYTAGRTCSPHGPLWVRRDGVYNGHNIGRGLNMVHCLAQGLSASAGECANSQRRVGQNSGPQYVTRGKGHTRPTGLLPRRKTNGSKAVPGLRTGGS